MKRENLNGERMIKKILIANRGEIAIRVMRAAKELGIDTAAIYSEADKLSPHRFFADESYYIGPSPASESYLNMEKIIDTAKSCEADAIHPGYGFLAENSTFAKMVEDAGIIFIGPNASAMARVGDKLMAREFVKSANGPLIPGMTDKSEDIKVFYKFADKVGYPVLIKAAMGGGGKGMRIVRGKSELEDAVNIAKRESLSAFGDNTVYLEKYIEKPHHIEVQVLFDNYGNGIYLFERECSIQRRYQKIIEESPSPFLDDALRKQMGETAVKIAKAVGYNSAGTVEFLVDKDKNFYFLEVNARVQVEHPVTEMVTGIDIVRHQILLAGGEKIGLKQEDISLNGSAIESRIYAEDEDNNFAPAPGKITYYREPRGPGIRVDSGITEDSDVSPFYDPILAKLIVWGENRDIAIKRMLIALNSYRIEGVKVPFNFLRNVFLHPEFQKGNLHTHFIQEHSSELFSRRDHKYLNEALAVYSYLLLNPLKRSASISEERTEGVWDTLVNWKGF